MSCIPIVAGVMVSWFLDFCFSWTLVSPVPGLSGLPGALVYLVPVLAVFKVQQTKTEQNSEIGRCLVPTGLNWSKKCGRPARIVFQNPRPAHPKKNMKHLISFGLFLFSCGAPITRAPENQRFPSFRPFQMKVAPTGRLYNLHRVTAFIGHG